jgi:transcription elongation GreA/GreB family factor
MPYWIITTRLIKQVQKRLRNQRLIGKQAQSENSPLSLPELRFGSVCKLTNDSSTKKEIEGDYDGVL